MKKSTLNLVFFIPLFVLILILVLGAIFVLPSIFKKTPVEQYIKYKDDISDLDFYNSDNVKQTFSTDKYKIVFYLSSDCGACIEGLPIIQRINDIFCKEQNIDLYLMWEDNIPIGKVKNYNLQDHSFSLKNVSISSTYSSSFLLDESNTIVFSDNNSYENTLSVIMELDIINTDIMQNNASNYIIETFTAKKSDSYLIYFSMPGCKDCNEATPLIDESIDIKDKFEIIRIERDLNANPGDIVDQFNIFRKAYSIDWYPSFAILQNGKTDMVRQLDISELVSTILDKAES